MEFVEWMRSEGLSESTILKYQGALQGPLTDWANEVGMISGSILAIRDHTFFENVMLGFKELDIFSQRDATGHHMYSSALRKFADYLDSAEMPDIEQELKAILQSPEIPVTEKAQLVTARIGQGRFRRDVISLWGRCSVTKYNNTSLLLASHIKPWSVCDNRERLDANNALLLIPNLDRAFDNGFVTFDVNGKILISAFLKQPEILGLNADMAVELNSQQAGYMEYHREKVFERRNNRVQPSE